MVIVDMGCHRAAAGHPVWGGLWPDHVSARDPGNTVSLPCSLCPACAALTLPIFSFRLTLAYCLLPLR